MKYAFLFMSMLACCQLTSQESPPFTVSNPEAVGLSAERMEEMSTFFQGLVDSDSLAGVQTAIIKDGKLAHSHTYGYADIEAGRKLDDKSIFRIFSMTKPIVSVALMQLVEQGMISLDDKLSKHLPEFGSMKLANGSAAGEIKVVDLLRHTSGLGYGRGGNEVVDAAYRDASLNALRNNEEYAAAVAALPLYFEPGTDWMYSISTNIVGAMVARVSGLELDTYLRRNILDPLGMKDTHFQLPSSSVKDFTVGYRWSSEGALTIAEPHDNSRFVREVTLFNGGGGLVSTTYDYLKFCQMFIDGGTYNGSTILQPETIALMTQDHLAEVREKNSEMRMPGGGGTGFGLGFAVSNYVGSRSQPIYGWGGAVGTYFRIDPENNMAYVMMIQLSPHRHLRLRERFQRMVLEALE